MKNKKYLYYILSFMLLILSPMKVEASTQWMDVYPDILVKQDNIRKAFDDLEIKVNDMSVFLFDLDGDTTPEVFVANNKSLEKVAIFSYTESEIKLLDTLISEPGTDNWFSIIRDTGEIVYLTRIEDGSTTGFKLGKKGAHITKDVYNFQIEKSPKPMAPKAYGFDEFETFDSGKRLPTYKINTEEVTHMIEDYQDYRADCPVRINYNGEILELEQPIIHKNGRNFYPFRQLFEAIGARVDWHEESLTASAMRFCDKGNVFQVHFVIEKDRYKVRTAGKDKVIELDENERAFFKNGRTYIPIRQAMEGLGYTVTWNSLTDTIEIMN